MTTIVRIAVIGAGIIGPRHAEAIQKCHSARLVGFVDPGPDTRDLSSTFSVPYYTSIKEMLSSMEPGKPEAAIVCTPNDTHVSLTRELLSAGIHVLVEKPLCTNVEEGEALVRYAAEQGLQLLVGHHRRFNPYVVAAKKALNSDIVGKVIAVNGVWMLKKPDSYFNGSNSWRANAESGGPVRINLVHDIDILQHLLGPVTRVFAERTIAQRGNSTEEGAAVVLRFASGAVGTFLLSDNTPSGHNFEGGTGENPMIARTNLNFYRIFGAEGCLSVPDLTLSKHKDWSEPLDVDRIQVVEGIPFESQIEHFVEVLKGRQTPSCSGQDGLRAVKVCNAVSKAMEIGLPVIV